MHILLTRPIDDCIEMIEKFKSLGHDVSHLALLNIEKVNHENFNYDSYDALIFSSSNSIKFLDIKNINKDIKCFSVGSATERKIRALGFQNVIPAEGSVNSLIEIIQNNFDTSDGKLLYISGQTIAYELDKDLKNKGYNIDRLINYKTSHNDFNDINFIKELKKKIPNIVYIYSENSAKSFLKFINNSGLKDDWMDTNLMCMGEKASIILNEIKWKKIFLFNPGEEEFLLYKI
ncbi:uroporphyrinogen-III synthase [Candidatus Pelagibacter sp.]|uniref:uroporphyrinogen-III synthase n=1 Tax=Candidatus Pelagibacter sp. TaxID=2024849 RepID=UPI003F840FD3